MRRRQPGVFEEPLGVVFVGAVVSRRQRSNVDGGVRPGGNDLVPPDALRVKSSQMLLGDLLRREGKLGEALTLLREASAFSETLPQNNTLRPIALARRAEAELAAGDEK